MCHYSELLLLLRGSLFSWYFALDCIRIVLVFFTILEGGALWHDKLES